MANGNGSGRWISETTMKILVAVITAAIISGLGFGMRVYAFMAAGDRFTPEMHQDSVDRAWTMAREEFMQKDVYATDRQHLDRRLDRIERKLDEVLALHTGED